MIRRASLLRTAALAVLCVLCGLLWRPYFHWETVTVQKVAEGMFFVGERPDHTGLQALLKNEGLRTLSDRGPGDMRLFSSLLRWSSRLFPYTSPFPRYPPWNANEILRRIREGETGGFCAQYAMVLGQVLQGLGYPVRFVDLADEGLTNTHFVVEVYSRELGKWVVLEAMLGFMYVDRGGNPLSALEVHKRFAAHDLTGLHAVPKLGVAKDHAFMYRNIRVEMRNNFLSAPVYVRWEKKDGKDSIFFFPSLMVWAGGGTTFRNSPGLLVKDESIFNFTPASPSGPLRTYWTLQGLSGGLAAMQSGECLRVRLPPAVLATAIRRLYGITEDFRPLE